MDISLTSDVYEPSINEQGDYIDHLPPSSKFANGLRCPCGTRREHVYDSRNSFACHIKTKSHQKWLQDLNINKCNYFSECEKLKDVLRSQTMIIARLEQEIDRLGYELQTKIKTIDYLSNQLMMKDMKINNVTDLMSFD